jgi:hypothetical protein
LARSGYRRQENEPCCQRFSHTKHSKFNNTRDLVYKLH